MFTENKFSPDFLFIKIYIYMGILFSMIYTYLEISNISNTDVLFR